MRILNETEEALDEVIERYLNGEACESDVSDFCFDLEPTEENKKILLSIIECYDFEAFYDVLLGKFQFLLTEKEKKHCQERYFISFGQEFGSEDDEV